MVIVDGTRHGSTSTCEPVGSWSSEITGAERLWIVPVRFLSPFRALLVSRSFSDCVNRVLVKVPGSFDRR